MKAKKLLLLLMIFVGSLTLCEGQSWTWARQGFLRSTGDGSEGWAVATDFSGNAFLVGEHAGDTLIFGTDTLIYLLGYFQTYLVKYSPTGNVLWVKQSENSIAGSYGYGYSVATDMVGNSYITGFFDDTISFDSYGLKAHLGSFLVKYDPNGNVLWAKQANGQSSSDRCSGLSTCTDKYSNIYITGYFNDTMSFGAIQLTEKYNSNTGIFIAKYDSNGNLKWAKQVIDSSEIGSSIGQGITSDKKGNIYVTGYFNDTAYFGTYQLIAKDNNRSGDIFIAKYDSIGNAIWAKQAIIASSKSSGQGFGICTDKYNSVYITGDFKDTILIGTNTLISNSSFTYNHDLFVAKFNSNGNSIWAESATILDSSSWTGYSISIDTNENLYLTAGGYGPPNYRIAFGTDTFRTYIGTETSDGASLVLKLDTCGALICGSIVAGGGDDNNSIAVDASGNHVYFGGDMDNDVLLGNDSITHPLGHEVPFLAKWAAPCPNPGCTVTEASLTPTSNKPSAILFPNPNNGIFTITLRHAELVSASQATIEVYDVLGTRVYYATLKQVQGDYELNISSQPAGIYLYRVIDENGRLIGSGKFVIQK